MLSIANCQLPIVDLGQNTLGLFTQTQLAIGNWQSAMIMRSATLTNEVIPVKHELKRTVG